MGNEALLVSFQTQTKAVAIVFNFSDSSVAVSVPEFEGDWATILESSAACWRNSAFDTPSFTNCGVQSDSASAGRTAMESGLILSPHSFIVFAQTLGTAK